MATKLRGSVAPNPGLELELRVSTEAVARKEAFKRLDLCEARAASRPAWLA